MWLAFRPDPPCARKGTPCRPRLPRHPGHGGRQDSPVGGGNVDTVGHTAPLHLLQVTDELLPLLRGHVHVVAVVVPDLEAAVVQPLDLVPVQVAALVGELQSLGDEERGPEPVAAQQRGYERGIRLLPSSKVRTIKRSGVGYMEPPARS